ncbi:MAG: hypothetical protein ACR2QG_00260 [Gammaproteobacteria bacterium]
MKTFTAFFSGLIISGSLLGSSDALAQTVELQHKAEQIETTADNNGNEQKRLVPATRVVPGEEILFTITYTNNGEEPAENIKITNPVPDYMDYMDGSAEGDNTSITYSVDGGNNFDTPDNLTVSADDGTQRPAGAADYTHIRWTLNGDITPGSEGTVQFMARVE